MNQGKDNPGFTKRLIRSIRRIVRDILGLDMSVDNIIEHTRSMVRDNVASTPTYTDPMANLDIKQPIARAAARVDVNASTNKEYQADVLAAPQTLYAAVMDAVFAGNTTGLRNKAYASSHKIKEKWLAFMPQSEVIRDAINKGMNSFSELEDLENKIRAEAHTNIESVQNNVLKPITELKKAAPDEYLKTAELMHYATVNDRDMKGSRRFNNLSKEAQDVYVVVENMYKDQNTKYIDSIRNQMESKGMSDADKAELESYIQIFTKGQSKTYFPLQRFGRYRVDAVLNGKQYTSFYDDMGEVRRAEQVLEEQGATSIMFKNKPHYQQYAEQVMGTVSS